MFPEKCQLTLSHDAALLLSVLLVRASSDGATRPCDSAERRALSDLSAALCMVLPEPAEGYLEAVAAARARLTTTGPGVLSQTPLVAYVDVDDTLVRSSGSKRIPIQAMVDRVKELHSIGVELFCWSTGGGDYAHRTAVELGIAYCFLSFLPKPMILVDDQPVADWRGLRYFHPNEAASRSLQELTQSSGSAQG